MRETNLTGRDLSAVLIIVIIWGSNFVAMKIGLRDFTPLQLGFFRYLFVILPLIFFVRKPQLPWKWFFIYGFLQGFAQFSFLFLALKIGMSASLAPVILQTQIFFTAFLSYFFLTEKPTPSLWIGLGLAALGLSCFVMNFFTPEHNASDLTTLGGLILSMMAASMWAGSNITIRLINKYEKQQFDIFSFLVWCGLTTSFYFGLATYILDDPSSRWDWMSAGWLSWLCVAFLGWISILMANTLWTTLIRKYSANRIAPFSLGIPVFGLGAGMLLLNESITSWQWAGIGFVFLALLQVIFGGRIKSLLARQTGN